MAVRSLRARIAVFFLILLVLVQGVAAILVTRANGQVARETIDLALVQGERIFQRLLAQNQARLEQGAVILSKDFAFRQAIATGSTDTIVSVLRNHGGRLGASAMMLISLDRVVRADTQDASRAGKPFAFPALIDEAANAGQATAVAVLGSRPYQLVIVPLLAPEAIAWVGLAFEVNDDFAREMRQLTGLEVSFLTRPAPGAAWTLHASTLEAGPRNALAGALPPDGFAGRSIELDVAGVAYQSRETDLRTATGTPLAAVLQRPLAEGLLPFRRIDNIFFGLAIASLMVLTIGSLVIARGITRPVQRLAEGAKRVQQGDYSNPVQVEQRDELGELAVSFNHMLDGIKSRELEILRLAYEDGLTALPNRAMFQRQLEQAVLTARRNGEPLTVMVIDLDRFKAINDTLGHPVGDQVLREVALRVRAALRESDIVSRLGGDEFAVLLASGDAALAPQVAEKILKALEKRIVVDGQSMDLGASIGLAIFPQHGEDAAALLRAADVAMYVAKRNKGSVSTYDPRVDERRREHLTLLGELRSAVENDELVLHYQPKMTLASMKVTSVEALVRWDHPMRGFVPPSEFIPFAEQSGYISAITYWVLRRAVKQCGQWHRQGLQLRVSVNISARDLRGGEALVTEVAEALRAEEVPASLLCLEITESGLMDDPVSAQATLRRIRDLGVAMSIDDYGTGYSSLAYIKQLPVNELKIDRVFVAGMEVDTRNAAIVRSTIELGHNLGLVVVAEGVETEYEVAELKRFGCDVAQGYRFARPMPAKDLEAWLARN